MNTLEKLKKLEEEVRELTGQIKENDLTKKLAEKMLAEIQLKLGNTKSHSDKMH